MMIRQTLTRAVRPLRVLLGKFVLVPEPEDGTFIGQHGCLNTAASFYAWNQIEGDYLEFGTYRGDSFAAAYHAVKRARSVHGALMKQKDESYARWIARPPRFFAFDSFEGLPAGSVERQVDYTPGSYSCSERDFRANVAARGVDLADVVTVPGYFDQSLNAATKQRHGLERAAVVMIDCDLYESTVPVLDFLTDIVGQGTIIIFHDWFRFKGSPEQGEQRACREWLAQNPQIELTEYWREGPQAVAFMVNLRGARS
jgi:O-methyltransferase